MVASGRKQRNWISAITNEFGVLFEEENIQRVFEDHFSKLFTAKDNLDIEKAVGVMEHKVSDEMLCMLSHLFIVMETTKALFQMLPSKVPRHKP
ncbi:hypothetical protein ACS0TY_034006 [Phlomoides rotata]